VDDPEDMLDDLLAGGVTLIAFDRSGIGPLLRAVLCAPIDWQATSPGGLGLAGFEPHGEAPGWWDFTPGEVRVYLEAGHPSWLACTVYQVASENATHEVVERIWIELRGAFDQAVAFVTELEGEPSGVWEADDPEAPDDHNGARVADWFRGPLRIRLTAEQDPDMDLHILGLELTPIDGTS